MTTLADIAARLDRMEKLLERMAPPEPANLHGAILDCVGAEWWTCGELWRLANAEADAAAVAGNDKPKLLTAMETEGIGNAHGLGRWVARQESGFERGGENRLGLEWRCA